MPTYSYRCTECDTAFDIHQAFSDASLTVCPTCGGMLRKVFSPIGVSFTGSGFYRNDSRAQPVGEKGGDSAKVDTAKPDTVKTDTVKTDTARKSPDSKQVGRPPKEKVTSTPGTSSGTSKAAASNATP